jgi:hypothetical protein
MSAEGETLKFLSYLTGAPYVLCAVSVLVVAQASSEVPEGLMYYPAYTLVMIFVGRSPSLKPLKKA